MIDNATRELELLETISELAEMARKLGYSRRKFARQLRKLHRQSMRVSIYGKANKRAMKVILDNMLEIAWPVGT